MKFSKTNYLKLTHNIKALETKLSDTFKNKITDLIDEVTNKYDAIKTFTTHKPDHTHPPKQLHSHLACIKWANTWKRQLVNIIYKTPYKITCPNNNNQQMFKLPHFHSTIIEAADYLNDIINI